MDVPAQQRKRVSGEYQMMMDGFSLPWPDPDFYTAFFGTGGASYARAVEFSDPGLDRLLDEAGTTLDPAKRAAIYAQVEQRVVEWRPGSSSTGGPRPRRPGPAWAATRACPAPSGTRGPRRTQVRLPGGLSDGVRRRGLRGSLQHRMERARRGRHPRDDDGRRRVRSRPSARTRGERGSWASRRGARAAARHAHARVPDVRWDEIRHVVHPDVAVVEWITSGTPHGRTHGCEVYGCDVLALRDGHIAATH